MRLVAIILAGLLTWPALAQDLPMPATPVGEIPPGRPVMIAGIVTSAGPNYFVINDGGASIVVSSGPGWQAMTSLREGDRVRVVGQLDRFGSGMFMAGAVATTDGRSVSLQPYR